MLSFTNLLVVMAIAFAAPFVLGIAEVDEAVQVVALLALAFVLFLAGLEIEFEKLRGQVLRIMLLGFALSFALAVVASLGLGAGGLVDTPLLVAIILCATSLGVLVPVLKDSGEISSTFGQLIIAAASIADFEAIILLTCAGLLSVVLFPLGGLVSSGRAARGDDRGRKTVETCTDEERRGDAGRSAAR